MATTRPAGSNAARAGFGDGHDQMIAADPKKVNAVKADGYSAVKKGDRLSVSLARKRNSAISENVQRAEMILDYLAAHPKVAAIIKRRLKDVPRYIL